MKAEERRQARQLRREQGLSVGALATRVRCSKSSVSRWVRDIPLTAEQVTTLLSNQDRGRAKAAEHPNSPKHFWSRIRTGIIESAAAEIPSALSPDVLKVVGAALYWAEGSKRGRNNVVFSNSDPYMVRLMIRFFREVCQVPSAKLRGTVNIHPHLSRVRAEEHWSTMSGIPPSQFYKTQTAVSRASQQKKDTLPLGTFKISICDTRMQSRILGWISGLQRITSDWAVSSVG